MLYTYGLAVSLVHLETINQYRECYFIVQSRKHNKGRLWHARQPMESTARSVPDRLGSAKQLTETENTVSSSLTRLASQTRFTSATQSTSRPHVHALKLLLCIAGYSSVAHGKTLSVHACVRASVPKMEFRDNEQKCCPLPESLSLSIITTVNCKITCTRYKLPAP